MISQIIFRLILGVILICSTPAGMAKEYIPEEVRADFFAAGENLSADDDGKGFQEAVLSLNDEAALFEAESSESFESQTEVESKTKRLQKRQSGKKNLISKIHAATGLPTELLSKGAARHPLTQDARQERRAVIRFLQIQALVC